MDDVIQSLGSYIKEAIDKHIQGLWHKFFPDNMMPEVESMTFGPLDRSICMIDGRPFDSNGFSIDVAFDIFDLDGLVAHDETFGLKKGTVVCGEKLHFHINLYITQW